MRGGGGPEFSGAGDWVPGRPSKRAESPIGATIGPSGAKGPPYGRSGAAVGNHLDSMVFRNSARFNSFSGKGSRAAQFPMWPMWLFRRAIWRARNVKIYDMAKLPITEPPCPYRRFGIHCVATTPYNGIDSGVFAIWIGDVTTWKQRKSAS